MSIKEIKEWRFGLHGRIHNIPIKAIQFIDELLKIIEANNPTGIENMFRTIEWQDKRITELEAQLVALQIESNVNVTNALEHYSRAKIAESQLTKVRDFVRWSTKYDHGDTAVDTVMEIQKVLAASPQAAIKGEGDG